MRPILKILICDDDHRIAGQIADITDNTLQNTEHRLTICSTEEELRAAIRKNSFSIALLDIALSESVSGIDLGAVILKQNPECRILFLTSYIQYAQDVYDVEHVGFILKSEMKERLPQALQKILRHLSEEETETVTINTGHTILILQQSRILYLERCARLTFLHLSDQPDPVGTYEHLEDIMLRLKKDSFFQCHKSFAINWKYVDKMSGSSLRISDGTIIPISRSHYQDARQNLLRYTTGI
jgi:DNA-binding LytR/AlgR family response regulator